MPKRKLAIAARCRLALLAGGVAACGLIVLGPALGAGGIKYVTKETSVPNAEPGRTAATAKCPAGRHVTGGGAEITGDDSTFDLEVGSTLPAQHNKAWTAGANNSSFSAADMTVTAVCSPGTFVYKTVTLTVPVDKAKHRVAKCPLGTYVLGGGAGAPGDHGVEVFQSEPTDGPDKGTKLNDAWEGGVDNGQDSDTKLTVTAICAKVPKRSVKKVSGARKVLPNNTEDSATAMCPSGTHVVGGGAHTHPHSTDSEVESTFPIDGPDSDTKPDDGWEAVANNDGSGVQIDLHSIALCVA
jgi:hypothetical protein